MGPIILWFVYILFLSTGSHSSLLFFLEERPKENSYSDKENKEVDTMDGHMWSCFTSIGTEPMTALTKLPDRILYKNVFLRQKGQSLFVLSRKFRSEVFEEPVVGSHE